MPRAWGIGYFQSDYAVVSSAPSGQPADLLRPSDNFSATWDFGGTGRATGVVIAPNWILTAAHTAYDPALQIQIGADPLNQYKVATDSQGQVRVFVHPTLDVGLIEIVALDGAGPTLDYAPIAAPIDSGNVPVTIAGYGAQRTFDDVTALTDGIVLGDSELRWGRNVAILGRSSLLARMDKPSTDAGAPNIDYVKYESQPLGGDSGGGWFIRNGWQWELLGITSTGGVALPFPALPSDAGAPKVAAAEIRDWIQQTLAGDFPASPSESTRPAATVHWVGSTVGNWSTSANWQDATTGIGRLPDFSPSRADVVSIVTATGPMISGPVAAQARDLFVGSVISGPGSPPASVTIQAGGQLVADSVFLGTQTGEYGELRFAGGSISATSEYVGFRGRGVLWHTAGKNSTVTLSVGKDNQSTDGTSLYLMLGVTGAADTPQLQAGRVVLGEAPGSAGQFVMLSGEQATVASAATIVGDHGVGTFNQFVGSHTVATDLILGNHQGSHGSYVLDRNANLKTGRTVVGAGGVGVFQQYGGLHDTESLQVSDTGSYTLLGGTLQTNSISGEIEFSNSTARLLVSGLGKFADATFTDAQNATLEMGAESLVLLARNTPFASVVNHGSLPVHIVGTPLTIDAGGFRGFGDLDDPLTLSGNGHAAATAGPQPLRLTELRLSGSAHVDVEANATLEIASADAPALVAEGGTPRIHVVGTLAIAQQTPDVGLRVKAGAHLELQTGEEFGDQSFQFVSTQGDIVIETNAMLTANGGVNFAVGKRLVTVDGTLEVGPGVRTLAIRSLGLNSSEDVTLQFGDSAKLEIGLASAQHDKIAIVKGSALLDGELALVRAGGYVPELGSEFNILSAEESVAGVFRRITGTVIELGLDTTRDDLGLAVRYVQDDLSKLVQVRATLLGDVDFDDSVDLEDYGQVEAHFGSVNATWEMGDFNGDGAVGEEDLDIVSNNLGLIRNPNAVLGDYDQNGLVNAADYAVWRKSLGDVGAALAADGNANQRIDTGDYEVWRVHFGQNLKQAGTTTIIPEPPTGLIMVIGCLVPLRTAGRRRKGSSVERRESRAKSNRHSALNPALHTRP